MYDNIFLNLYILEINFLLTFTDITVTAMPVTNCIYNFYFHFVMAAVKLYRESIKQEYEESKQYVRLGWALFMRNITPNVHLKI